MKKMLVCLVGLFVFCIISITYAVEYGDIIGCKVIRDHDGDTIVVSIPNEHPLFGKEIGVRISHIDAPELHGRCQAEIDAANKVKDMVIKLVPVGSIINLHHVQRDKYFRILADVEAGGMDVATQLISTGVVRKYNGEAKKSWCDNEGSLIPANMSFK